MADANTSSEKQPHPAAADVEKAGDAPGAVIPDQEDGWDNPQDPENPFNWSFTRKLTVGVVCSASSLVTTMSASMVTPAMDDILEDIGMSEESGQLAFSAFFLGLGFAPLFIAPMAEIFGRRPVWLCGNVFYILWNALCPVDFNAGLMIAGRVLASCGSSVGVTLTSAVMADMFKAQDRGKSAAVAGILPYIGPALGPIIGGVAAEYLWWPWLFWILSIADTVVLILGFILMRETYAPVLLQRRAEKRARESGAPAPTFSKKIKSEFQSLSEKIGPALYRPTRLIIRRPIVQLLAFAAAIDFGLYAIVLGSFASLFMETYHQSETEASLHYISIALGAIIEAQGGGYVMDLVWRRENRLREGDPTPEYRIPHMLLGVVPGVAGLLMYGWAAETQTHWIVVDIGAFLFTLGSFMFTQGLLAYLVDEFTSKWSASAGASIRVGTYVAGFAFPIFSPELFSTLGYGWGNSLLALIFLLSTLGTLAVMKLWGPKLRAIRRTTEDKEALMQD